MSEFNPEEICKVSVNTLCDLGLHFVIPSYQRGYRWRAETHVRQLIDDLKEFDQRKQAQEHYCFQPLVVRRSTDSEGREVWRVVDGQQRLTTMWLLLRPDGSANAADACFHLEYERGTLLDNVEAIGEAEALRSPDKWHLLKALEELRPYRVSSRGNKIPQLLGESEFIWYPIEVCEGEEGIAKEREMFSNLNSGKIALTDSELIKALLLRHVAVKSAERETALNRVVEELDAMERRLHEPAFWAFLGGPDNKACRLDFVHSALCETHNDYDAQQTLPLFHHYCQRLSQGQADAAGLLDELRTCFRTLEGWYENPLTYNLIGYLRNRQGNSLGMGVLYRAHCQQGTRSEFNQYLLDQCRTELRDSKNVSNIVDQFSYTNTTHRRTQFNVLLLENIVALVMQLETHTLLDGSNEEVSSLRPEDSIERFDFAQFRGNRWSLEHIMPQSSLTFGQRRELFSQLPEEVVEHVKELATLRERYRQAKDATELPAGTGELESRFFCDDDTLSNLTLLTGAANSSLGNKVFVEKRAALDHLLDRGCYVPPRTLLVFAKWHSKSDSTALFFTQRDRTDYANEHKRLLNAFLRLSSTQPAR